MIVPEAVVGACVVGGLGLLSGAILAIYNAVMRRAWRHAARELRLTVRPAMWHAMPTLEGRIGDARIRVHARHLWGGWATAVEIAGLGRFPCDVEATPRTALADELSIGDPGFGRGVVVRGLAHRAHRALAELGLPDEVSTGDPAFDRSIAVRGLAHRALAVLDRDARHAVRECLRVPGHARIGTHPSLEGRIELDVPGVIGDSKALVQAVRDALVVAKAASLGERSLVEALAVNARDDMPGVRERCLDALVGEYPRHALTLEACRVALADPHVDVRLAAARGFGQEAHPVLETIIRDGTIPPTRRLAALELRLQAPLAAIGPLLDLLLEDDDELLRPRVIAAIGSRHWSPALGRLLAIAEPLPQPHIVELPTALGQLGDVRAQPILLRWLAAGETWDEMRMAVVLALGRVGNVDAVPALEPLTHGFGPSYAFARVAIRSIQVRLGPIDGGRVSLVELDDAAGELSVADDADGRVSLEPRDDHGGAP